MSSVIIGKPNIKYLQTFANNVIVIDATQTIKISEFKTNVQDIYDKAKHLITVTSFMSAGATVNYELYDNDNNLITSWSFDNSANTVTMKGIKVYDLGYFKNEKYPLNLKITATGTVETGYSVHPDSWSVDNFYDTEKFYFVVNSLDIGDSGGSVWKTGGIAIAIIPTLPRSDTNNTKWGRVYWTDAVVSVPLKFALYFQSGVTEDSTTTTNLVVRIRKGIVFWV